MNTATASDIMPPAVLPVATPNLLPTGAIAKLLGTTADSLWRRSYTDKRLTACIVHQTKSQTFWSVQRLKDRGYLN
jgi:hypothetical protein